MMLLHLTHGRDGKLFPTTITNTTFVKPIEDMTDRRLRTLLKIAQPLVDAVLSACHPTDGARLLLLLAANDTSASARNALTMERICQLPMVRDVVDSYNRATDPAVRTQILSFLVVKFATKTWRRSILPRPSPTGRSTEHAVIGWLSARAAPTT